LKHDSIGALGVPARTSDYSVKDSSILEQVKVGDKVRFSAVLQGRSLLVTNIAPAN
jgi:Cu/Ag efflux protein CusF